MAIATASLAVLAWLAIVGVPAVGLSLDRAADGGLVVSDVPRAEAAWLVGVRPGMTVVGATPVADPTHWESLLVSDGSVTLTIQRHPLAPDPVVLAAGLVALLLATIVYRAAPGIAFWVVVIPTLASLALASDLVPAAVGLGLFAAPVAIGALCVADRRRELPRFAVIAAGIAVAVVDTAWLVGYGMRLDSWAALRVASAAGGVGLLSFASIGIARQAYWRARNRLARHGSSTLSPLALFGATIDELIPGRAHSRLIAIESERTRLASDLHAEVMPALAEVIRSADAGTDPSTATRLRVVADDLRDLMAERRLAVLEELGLVPALEWLAERVEERAHVRVEIDIAGDDIHRLPTDVELAAYRIAQQAIDNALVHAQARTIRIEVSVSGQRLELEIVDDGLGLPVDAEARALRAGHLGLADMRARATAIGGAFQIGGRPGGGTTAALQWPA